MMATHRPFRDSGPHAAKSSPFASLLTAVGGELIHNPLLATLVTRAATHLRNGGAQQIANNVGRIARRHPAVVVVGGIALGVLCARAVRAAMEKDVIDGDFERATPDTLVRREHLTTVSPSSRRR